MPRRSRFGEGVLSMPGAVYSPFADRLADHPGPIFPLHVGDTWLEPFVGARMEDLRAADWPGLNRYSETRGVPELVPGSVSASQGTVTSEDPVAVTVGDLAPGASATVSFSVAIASPLPLGLEQVANQASATSVELPAALSDDPETPEYFLWRFMIDARYQSLGFGRQALELVIDHVRTRPSATEFFQHR